MPEKFVESLERPKSPTSPIIVSKIFLVLSVVAIVAIGIEFYRKEGHISTEAFGIFIIVSFYIITEKIQAFYSAQVEAFSRDFDEYSLKLLNTQMQIEGMKLGNMVMNSISTVYVGSHSEALSYCCGRFKAAKRIKDTYFRNEPDQVLQSYRKISEEYFLSGLNVIKEGGSFEVIASKHNIEKLLKTSSCIINFINESDSFGKWQLFSVDQGKIPVINMIIISYTDFREVLFGWNYSNTDDGIVFSSKDEKVVRYFDNLFDRTRAVAEQIDISMTAVK